MKNFVLSILSCFFIVNAWPPVTNFTYYWNPSAGDTVTFTRLRANNDSVKAGTARIIAELNNNVVHFNQGTSNHDSVVHYVKIDTIGGNPLIDSLHGNIRIDSIKGNVRIDTINVDYINVTTINNDTITNDTMYSNKINSGVLTSRGVTNTDSLYSYHGIFAASGSFSGKVNADTIYCGGGTETYNLTVDNLLNVDTVHSTKGITATTGGFSGTVNVDSLHATKGFTASTGDFTSLFSVWLQTDSVRADKYSFDTSAACSLYDGATVRVTSTAPVKVVGDFMIMKLPIMIGTITGSTTTTIHFTDYFQGSNSVITVPISNNGTIEMGRINPDGYTVTNLANSYLTAGTGGIPYTTLIVIQRK
jgi:hypothetical protein